ncbi:MAG TPA: putative phage abortive infection protein, partial [Rhodocyclaceae bacterium]
MGSELPKEPPKELSFWVLVWIALGVIALWAGTGFLLYDTTLETPIWGERGTFGDMFGSINALFSGLAFAGLFFTVLLQRQELQLQRHELKLQREEIQENRKELAGQRLQLEAQSKTFIQQRFEGTFFQLFPYFSRIAEAAGRYRDAGDIANAKGWITQELRQESAAHHRFENMVSAAYQTVLNKRQFPFLPRYFRALYSVIAFVDRGTIEDRQFYANLVRNELSSHECELLAYVGLSDLGEPKLKPLIERYRLLKNIPNQFLFDNLPL